MVCNLFATVAVHPHHMFPGEPGYCTQTLHILHMRLPVGVHRGGRGRGLTSHSRPRMTDYWAASFVTCKKPLQSASVSVWPGRDSPPSAFDECHSGPLALYSLGQVLLMLGHHVQTVWLVPLMLALVRAQGRVRSHKSV